MLQTVVDIYPDGTQTITQKEMPDEMMNPPVLPPTIEERIADLEAENATLIQLLATLTETGV